MENMDNNEIPWKQVVMFLSESFEHSITNVLIDEYGDEGVITDAAIESMAVAIAHILQPYDKCNGDRSNMKEKFISDFVKAYKFFNEYPEMGDENK